MTVFFYELMKCKDCGAVVKDVQSLRRHDLRFHKTASPRDPKILCALCHDAFLKNSELELHVKQKHDVSLKHEHLTFNSADDFKEWKRTIEAELNAKYIVSCSKKRSDKKLVYYICNRSGPVKSVPEESRKRHVKLKGSRKTGSQCLSRMNVNFFANGTVAVDFCSTHIGHKCALKHLPISSPTKAEIAAKIAARVPLVEVIDQVRQRAVNPNMELKREHLITNQDLRNIKSAFSLESEWILDKDDASSVTAWVEQERSLDSDSCVILFKPKGIMPAEFLKLQHEDEANDGSGIKNGLKKSDFLLGIMTRGQEEILKIHGMNGVISMDSTHGTNAYGYELTTIMVLDDLKQGFPVAFFVSDRQDLLGISTFLERVKEKVGPVKATTFMSDMARVFYNAWSLVMGECEFRLFCTWHVIRAWQQKIHELIKSDSKREDTYSKLYAMLTEIDKEAFEKMLYWTLHVLSKDVETSSFAHYFQKEYSTCPTTWAYCHRKKAGINTNMNLERMHSSLKHTFLGGKMTKRLDQTIHALMKLIDWKIFDRLLITENGKLSYKIRELRRRHTTAKSLSVDKIFPVSESNVWGVFPSSGTGVAYQVSLSDPNCVCSIRCTDCDACFHKYTCTCIDYEVKSVMCKHIHLLCRFLSDSDPVDQSQILPDDPSEGRNESPQLTIDENVENTETKALLSSLRCDKEILPPTLESKMKKIEDKFSAIAKSIKTERAADALMKVLNNAVPFVTAANDTLQIDSFESKKKINTNKNIEPQRKFTAKKKKTKGNKRLRRPAQAYLNHIAAEMTIMNSTEGPHQSFEMSTENQNVLDTPALFFVS